MLKLWEHQEDAVNALFETWKKSDSQKHLIVAPTGSGKSVIIAEVIHRLITSYPQMKILVLQHVKELIEQNYLEFVGLTNLSHKTGIFSAGLKLKETNKQITYASIQTLANSMNKFESFDLIIIDEAHMIPRDSDTRYKKLLKHYNLCNPNLRILGLTATPFRLKCGYLHKGDDKLFDDIVYDIKIQYLIDKGYLSPLISKCGSFVIENQDLKKVAGEYTASSLELATMKDDNTHKAVLDFAEKGKNRKKWLIFACSVKHALEIEKELTKLNITCCVIIGNTKQKDRENYIEDFKNNKIKCLINVNTLTTGFNVKDIDMLVWLRKTASPVLYIQGMGRGMRIAQGKKDCLVLDYVGNVIEHGCIDDITINEKKKSNGDEPAPAKICPECEMIIHASIRICPECGHEFPAIEKKVLDRSIVAPLLKSQKVPIEVDIKKTRFTIHEKNKKKMIRIEFDSNFYKTYTKFIFPEATTQIQNFYFLKFCRDNGMTPVMNCEKFIEVNKREAKKIKVVKNGRYFDIISIDWL